MEATILIVAIASLILLAVTAPRYGADSREGFPTKERELAGRGMTWGTAPSERDRMLASEVGAAHLRAAMAR